MEAGPQSSSESHSAVVQPPGKFRENISRHNFVGIVIAKFSRLLGMICIFFLLDCVVQAKAKATPDALRFFPDDHDTRNVSLSASQGCSFLELNSTFVWPTPWECLCPENVCLLGEIVPLLGCRVGYEPLAGFVNGFATCKESGWQMSLSGDCVPMTCLIVDLAYHTNFITEICGSSASYCYLGMEVGVSNHSNGCNLGYTGSVTGSAVCTEYGWDLSSIVGICSPICPLSDLLYGIYWDYTQCNGNYIFGGICTPGDIISILPDNDGCLVDYSGPPSGYANCTDSGWDLSKLNDICIFTYELMDCSFSTTYLELPYDSDSVVVEFPAPYIWDVRANALVNNIIFSTSHMSPLLMTYSLNPVVTINQSILFDSNYSYTEIEFYCYQTFELVDTQAPSFDVCPDYFTMFADTPDGVNASLLISQSVVVHDNADSIDNLTLICSSLSGLLFPPGESGGFCSVYDLSGNVNESCIFIVDVTLATCSPPAEWPENIVNISACAINETAGTLCLVDCVEGFAPVGGDSSHLCSFVEAIADGGVYIYDFSDLQCIPIWTAAILDPLHVKTVGLAFAYTIFGLLVVLACFAIVRCFPALSCRSCMKSDEKNDEESENDTEVDSEDEEEPKDEKKLEFKRRKRRRIKKLNVSTETLIFAIIIELQLLASTIQLATPLPTWLSEFHDQFVYFQFSFPIPSTWYTSEASELPPTNVTADICLDFDPFVYYSVSKPSLSFYQSELPGYPPFESFLQPMDNRDNSLSNKMNSNSRANRDYSFSDRVNSSLPESHDDSLGQGRWASGLGVDDGEIFAILWSVFGIVTACLVIIAAAFMLFAHYREDGNEKMDSIQKEKKAELKRLFSTCILWGVRIFLVAFHALTISLFFQLTLVDTAPVGVTVVAFLCAICLFCSLPFLRLLIRWSQDVASGKETSQQTDHAPATQKQEDSGTKDFALQVNLKDENNDASTKKESDLNLPMLEIFRPAFHNYWLLQFFCTRLLVCLALALLRYSLEAQLLALSVAFFCWFLSVYRRVPFIKRYHNIWHGIVACCHSLRYFFLFLLLILRRLGFLRSAQIFALLAFIASLLLFLLIAAPAAIAVYQLSLPSIHMLCKCCIRRLEASKNTPVQTLELSPLNIEVQQSCESDNPPEVELITLSCESDKPLEADVKEVQQSYESDKPLEADVKEVQQSYESDNPHEDDVKEVQQSYESDNPHEDDVKEVQQSCESDKPPETEEITEENATIEVDNARKKLMMIKRGEIDELRNYRRPPSVVFLILQPIALMLAASEEYLDSASPPTMERVSTSTLKRTISKDTESDLLSWKSLVNMIRDMHFFTLITSIRTEHIPESLFDHMEEKYFQDPEFNRKRISKVHRALVCLYNFISSFRKLYRLRRASLQHQEQKDEHHLPNQSMN